MFLHLNERFKLLVKKIFMKKNFWPCNCDSEFLKRHGLKLGYFHQIKSIGL